jgi:hypothetical protein
VVWVSLTSGDFDGLHFIIRLPKSSPAATPVAITFATTPFTLQMTAKQMVWFSAYYQISNTSGIAIHSQQINTQAHGLMEGHWIKATIAGDSGSFNGLWLDQSGNPTGVFSGIFWTQNDGQRLFSGNVSGNPTAQIIAYIHGSWYYDDPRDCALCGSGHGKFSGYFKYASSVADVGIIGGEFGDLSLPPNQLDLPLSGFWTVVDRWAVSTSANEGY